MTPQKPLKFELGVVWISPKKLANTQKTEKINKNRKSWNIEKKPIRGIALRNSGTNFGADWKVFRYRNDDTASVRDKKTVTLWQNDRITDI